MRWTRPLLLVAILAIVGAVGATFVARLREQNAGNVKKPAPLADGTLAASQGWSYTQTQNGKPAAWIHAGTMEEHGGKYHLQEVELHLFHKDSTVFDRIKSSKAEFDLNDGVLFSEGAVEITTGVAADDQPSGRLMSIKSSGVRFESKTGKATTDKPAEFSFDLGSGSATGAEYDPQTRELRMKSGVKLTWRGKNKDAKPMNVEAGDATYKERESNVMLGGYSKLKRDSLSLNAGPALVTLEDGLIRQVDTEHAQGTDERPGRKVEYAADKLVMNMNDDGEIEKITGEQNARLVSNSATGQTTVTSDRVDLGFVITDKESNLDTAVAAGHSVSESKPAMKQGVEPPDTRVLRSDVIKMKMRPGGQEMEAVETASAGALEFIPNRPGQPHRWMNGDRLWIQYAENNQIKSVRSVNVATKTEKPRAKDAKAAPPPSLTWSQELQAEFDPNTSQLSKLEQWNNFRYEEGARKAKADRALLEQQKNLIHLTGGSRVWDDTGSTDGDTILLNQQNGDVTAEGHVNSTRVPDKKPAAQPATPAQAPASPAVSPTQASAQGGLLSDSEPMHARAKKMIATDNNLHLRYEGDAVAWQGSNRLQADTIEIDRENDIVKGHGHVVSQLLDKSKEDKAEKPGENKTKTIGSTPVFTIVRAPEMTYNDEDRLAHYTGGVTLDRPNMKVKSQELRAFLRESDDKDDSSLDHAFADGNVEIVQKAAARTRTGTSEHAEYYVDEAKVILEKGHPQLVDSVKGSTKGRKLTWFSDDDRLLVDGAEGQPAQSRLRKK